MAEKVGREDRTCWKVVAGERSVRRTALCVEGCGEMGWNVCEKKSIDNGICIWRIVKEKKEIPFDFFRFYFLQRHGSTPSRSSQ